MPLRPKRPCADLACPGLAEYGSRYCKVHLYLEKADRLEVDRHYDQNRPAEEKKFYRSSRWLRLRGYLLARDPLCVMCRAKGRTEPATEVDHIIPRRDGGPDIIENLQGLCSRCHKLKTISDVRLRKKVRQAYG